MDNFLKLYNQYMQPLQYVYDIFDEYPVVPITLLGLVALLIVIKQQRKLKAVIGLFSHGKKKETSNGRRPRALQPGRGNSVGVPGRAPRGLPGSAGAHAGDHPEPRGSKTEAKTSRAKGMLNQILFWWTRRDPFRVRDLLAGGVLILGRSGSGKTSSSGRLLMRALADNPDSGGLILAAKPEDEEDVRRIFRRRENDLLVFDIDNLLRFNFLQYVGNWPARNVVQCLMTMGETLKRGEGKGKDEAPFWDALNERSLFNTVVPLKAAGEPISPERMLKFLMSAPTSPEEQRSDQWRALYHNKVMERASARPKSPIEVLDFQLAMEFWVKEYPSMDPKTRANGLAGVMNILHSFNQGIVREMCARQDELLAGRHSERQVGARKFSRQRVGGGREPHLHRLEVSHAIGGSEAEGHGGFALRDDLGRRGSPEYDQFRFHLHRHVPLAQGVPRQPDPISQLLLCHYEGRKRA